MSYTGPGPITDNCFSNSLLEWIAALSHFWSAQSLLVWINQAVKNEVDLTFFYFLFDLFSFILFLELGLGLEW